MKNININFVMRSLYRRWGSLALQSLGLIIFCAGFFRWEPNRLPSVNINDNNTASLFAANFSRPVFDKLVFMVIDALRADFVYGSHLGRKGFPWLNRQQGKRKSFVALARAPTVTLPRIKALTAGTAPRFLDLLTNLHGTTEGADGSSDSWVAQTSVLHYGDDTWMRLFPGLPGEGTHSFFVTDTVEVDRNVTRNLGTALERTDWTVLTLHYLGVDHIGHLGGVTSPLMIPKLQEMDGVIQRVYNRLVERDAQSGTKSAMVILGDHGMTDAGNHGGASPEELRTAAIFLSPHYNNDASDEREPILIDQVDIAPTVALLLGLEVPRGSTGRFISETLLPGTSDGQHRALLLKNAAQLSHLSGQRTNLTKSSSIEQVKAFIRVASGTLSAGVNEYKTTWLVLGILLMITSSFVAPPNWVALGLGLTYGFTQFSSTFLEEEHFFWHFLFTSLCLVAWYYNGERGWWRYGLAILSHRMIYYWNSTGYLYQNALDVKGILQSHSSIERALWLVSFILAGSAFTCLSWTRRQHSSWGRLICGLRLILLSFLLILGLFMKLGPPGQTSLERAVLAILGMLIITVLVGGGRGEGEGGIVLCLAFMLLLKRHNALPMLIITWIASILPMDSSEILGAGLTLCLLHSAYFLLGPCHLIPSIDFSPAYLGHTQYHPVLIPLIGYLVIWAGPLTVAGIRKVPGSVIPFFRALVGIMLLASMVLQRYHLFVWTVFAPRLVFELGWHLFYLLLSMMRIE